MKRKTAKEILTASFQELAAQKSVDKITVQEIVDNSGYSPATEVPGEMEGCLRLMMALDVALG
jgi:hypothetical protein